MSNALVPTIVQTNETTRRSSDDLLEVGDWFWVKGSDDKRWMACITYVGSNYAELKGPSERHNGIQSQRVHFEQFWAKCERIPDPDPIINGKIMEHQLESRALMEEVRAVTARLGMVQRQSLTDGGAEETKALSVRSSEPVEAYKKALAKAKEKTLPALFEQIEEANESLANWMNVKLIPMKAEAEALKGVMSLISDRIFSVELYAGLVETVVEVRGGEADELGSQIHLMQRRCYMDEECLAGYETGGMDYKDIKDFERWLCKPSNFGRLLPFPKTVVAFQIRRNDKEREVVNLCDFLQVMAERAADQSTFLYIRNGERLYRMETKIEFEEKLFPDTNHKILTATKLWAKDFHHDIGDLISDDEYQGRIEDEKRQDEDLAKMPKKERWKHERHRNTVDDYFAFTPASVYYDDIVKIIANEAKKHNMLVLVLQGLLDRSPVFHPHPPWQLWTGVGFDAAFKLIFDSTRALSTGDKPDFEAYRAKLNSCLHIGSITVGQQNAWRVREAEKENRRRDNDLRWRGTYRPAYYEPRGDPGPGSLAKVHKYRHSEGSCTYVWERSKRTRGYGTSNKVIAATLTTGEENVLNVDAYKPGDFHIFFDDPRTRQEYLKWAPLLLEAEECHAGNRDLKPNRVLSAPVRTPRVPTHDRAADLRFPKQRPPKPPIAERYEGKKAMLRYDMETTKGTKFKEGEIVIVTSYHRKKLSLKVANDPDRRISGVNTYSVTMME